MENWMADDQPFVIRPITSNDLGWLCDISNKLEYGFTTLSNNPDYLGKYVDTSIRSFAKQIPEPQRGYLLVRENILTKELVGIAGIDTCIGFDNILYHFEIANITQMSRGINKTFNHKVLNLVDNFQEATELVSLWLDPKARGKKFSKALSFSRLLFIAQEPQLFSNEIVAEIRGVIDDKGRTPFWEAVGRKFFGMSLVEADNFLMSTDKQFVSDLVPRLPIYVDLLPQEARAVIGVPHPTAVPAQKILESQGFKFNKYIDIFDGGPVLTVNTSEIKFIANSKLAKVQKINNAVETDFEAIIGNFKQLPRITAGKINEGGDGVIIAKDTAEILQLSEGDELRYARI